LEKNTPLSAGERVGGKHRGKERLDDETRGNRGCKQIGVISEKYRPERGQLVKIRLSSKGEEKKRKAWRRQNRAATSLPRV